MNLEKHVNTHPLLPKLSARILIVQNDAILLNKIIGNDLKENSQVIIASLTKHITAAALLKCVEKNLLDLHTPIGSYLNLKSPWALKVTVHHLLTHTSGLADHTAEWEAKKMNFHDLNSVINFIDQAPLPFNEKELGKVFRYNNTGYFLAGALVSKVTSKPLDIFLEEEFFKPLKMIRTFLPQQGKYKDLIRDPRAQNLIPGFDSNQKVETLDVSFVRGAGGLISTVEDLLIWARALFIGHTVLSKESLSQMMQPYHNYLVEDLKHLPANYYYHLGQHLASTLCSYGYGLRKIPFRGKMIQYAHAGRIDGYVTDFRYIPSKELGNIFIIAFTNRIEPIHQEKGRLWQFVNELVEIIYRQEEAQAQKKA